MTEERLEKVRKLREMKKFGKKVQIEVQQKREKDKKEMLDQVRFYLLLFLVYTSNFERPICWLERTVTPSHFPPTYQKV